jgi:acetylornithine deacetylase/succinyl-diaminopimelate desuccinylase-like protein
LLLDSAGFECKLEQGQEGKNPVVLGRLGAANDKPTIVFYGHYDVFPVPRASWRTGNPFELKGLDGYWYGRGATDNKGPILAMLFAAQEWQQARADHTELPVNIVMLIEGEEECDSEGFVEVVERNMSWFNNVMVVLLANTYWIGEDTVCLKC